MKLDWTAKQGKGEEQGYLEGGDTFMKQTEKATRREQSRKGEDRQQGEEGAETVAPSSDTSSKPQEVQAQTTDPQGKQGQLQRTEGSGGETVRANQGAHQDRAGSMEEIGL